MLTEAVHAAMATSPLTPTTAPLGRPRELDYASYNTTGDGYTLQVALKNTGIAQRPTSMTAAEARAAVQQLVYTAQAAIGKREPVAFTIGRKAHGPTTLLGVDISQPIVNGPALKTLSLVNISSPNEGDEVSGQLKVTGVNNAFEGNSVIYLQRNGRSTSSDRRPAGSAATSSIRGRSLSTPARWRPASTPSSRRTTTRPVRGTPTATPA